MQLYQGKTIIVLSHHLPSFQLISPQYKDNQSNVAYASNLEYLMDKVEHWACGHSHSKNEIKIDQCLCVLNPVGYPSEKIVYNDKIIDIN